MQVLDEVVARGASPEFIRVLSITVAPPALKQLSEKYPGAEKLGKAQRETCFSDMQGRHAGVCTRRDDAEMPHERRVHCQLPQIQMS